MSFSGESAQQANDRFDFGNDFDLGDNRGINTGFQFSLGGKDQSQTLVMVGLIVAVAAVLIFSKSRK